MKRGNGQSYERTVFTNFRSKDILLKGIDEISTLLRFLYMDESHSIVINNGLCDLRIRMTASMDILAQNLQFPSCPEMHKTLDMSEFLAFIDYLETQPAQEYPTSFPNRWEEVKAITETNVGLNRKHV